MTGLLNRDTQQEADDYIILDVPDLLSPHHTVLVRSYLAGQYRLQLTDKREPDCYAPEGHGNIVRELCTYHYTSMLATVLDLQSTIDPEAHCEALAQPWNCEYPGGRIRLDSQPPKNESAARMAEFANTLARVGRALRSGDSLLATGSKKEGEA